MFRVGWGGISFDTFNPFTTYAAISSWSTRNVYSRLVKLAPDLKSFVPNLAWKWEIVGDNTVRFYFVRNATFHDGKPVTAYIPIVSKHIWSQVKDLSTYDDNPPIGSEPLRVAECKEGQYIVLEPYPNFYYKSWLPKVDRINKVLLRCNKCNKRFAIWRS